MATFLLHWAVAVIWFCFMAGVLVPEPWFVKAAFFFLGLNSLLSGIKTLVDS